MQLSQHSAPSKRPRSVGVVIGAAVVLTVGATVLAGGGGAQARSEVIPLGAAESFSVLAGSGITNTGVTTVEGDIGSHPTPTIADEGKLIVGGENHAGDAVTQQAKEDLQAAYNDAASQKPPIAADDELGGETLKGGVYRHPSGMGLTGELTLDGEHDPDQVWVFQAGSTLTVNPSASVTLINEANPCNVYWQVGSSATLDTDAAFVGNIFAHTSITMNARARIEGRALALGGAVTMINNVITMPECNDVEPTTEPTTEPTDTPPTDTPPTDTPPTDTPPTDTPPTGTPPTGTPPTASTSPPSTPPSNAPSTPPSTPPSNAPSTPPSTPPSIPPSTPQVPSVPSGPPDTGL